MLFQKFDDYLKQVNFDKIQLQVQQSLKEIDFAKMQKDIDQKKKQSEIDTAKAAKATTDTKKK